MIVLDTSFLLDYLDGVAATAEFLEAHAEKPFYVPSLSLFEVYRGAARTNGDEGVDTVATALEWADPLPLTESTAREAARVEARLLDRGERINLGDTLIAGVCLHNGADIVTRDQHFERIDGLEVIRY